MQAVIPRTAAAASSNYIAWLDHRSPPHIRRMHAYTSSTPTHIPLCTCTSNATPCSPYPSAVDYPTPLQAAVPHQGTNASHIICTAAVSSNRSPDVAVTITSDIAFR